MSDKCGGGPPGGRWGPCIGSCPGGPCGCGGMSGYPCIWKKKVKVRIINLEFHMLFFFDSDRTKPIIRGHSLTVPRTQGAGQIS